MNSSWFIFHPRKTYYVHVMIQMSLMCAYVCVYIRRQESFAKKFFFLRIIKNKNNGQWNKI